MKLVIISAVSINGVIGKGNEIPWYIPEDFKHYKKTTIGHPVIIGLNTLKTLPELALKDRTYLVLSSNENNLDYQMDNVHFFKNINTLLDYIKLNYNDTDETIYIAGGQMIYNQFIDYCDEAIITFVDKIITFTSEDEVKIFPLLKLIRNYKWFDKGEWLTSVKKINYIIVKYKKIK